MIKNSIILVPFPFDDLSGSKVRPALCLTNEIGKYNQIIIAFISSQTMTPLTKYDIRIKKGSQEWTGTGLFTDSIIRLHKLVTIPKLMVKRKLGEINPILKEIIKKNLTDLLIN